MMKPELKVKWVEALTSGKYRQVKGYLHSYGRYCCLGVLCKLQGVSTEQMGECGAPSEAGRGLNGGLSEAQISRLAEMNDSGVPFEVVAGFIQENL